MTQWYHEDETCWVADCEVCDVPLVVWRSHGAEPPEDEVAHMLARLGEVANQVTRGLLFVGQHDLLPYQSIELAPEIDVHVVKIGLDVEVARQLEQGFCQYLLFNTMPQEPRHRH